MCLHSLRGSPICPVYAVNEYLGRCPQGWDPLLVHQDGSFLSVFQFVQIFRNCVTRTERDAKVYSAHSFRIWVATEAARWCPAPDVVKHIGRWESDRFKIFVRPHLL